MCPVRIAIRCRRRLYRDTLAGCLAGRPEFTVVGQVARPGDLLEVCALCRPDVVLFDVDRDTMDGLDGLRALRRRFPGLRVVLSYDRLSPSELAVAVRCGVDAFVCSSHGLDALLAVLRRRRPDVVGNPGLSDVDREVLALVAAGHSVERIAALLHTSKGAVEHRKRRIYHKLYVSGQCQAVARAVSLGLIARGATQPPPAASVDGSLLALLRGKPDLIDGYLTPALLAHGVPFARDGSLPDGRGLLVLADPEPGCWPCSDVAQPPIVLVSAANPGRMGVLDALRRGASAVVAADQVPPGLLVAVLTLASRGYLVLAVSQAREVLEAAEAWPGTPGGLPELTPRESDILRSIAGGRTVRQTARSLGIAEKTVENIQTRLYRKLGARNRTAALTVADTLGLIELLDVDAVAAYRE